MPGKSKKLQLIQEVETKRVKKRIPTNWTNAINFDRIRNDERVVKKFSMAQRRKKLNQLLFKSRWKEVKKKWFAAYNNNNNHCELYNFTCNLKGPTNKS